MNEQLDLIAMRNGYTMRHEAVQGAPEWSIISFARAT